MSASPASPAALDRAAPTAANFLPLVDFDPTGLRGLFTDIDDTLTIAGRLPAVVLAAMERLVAAGIAVVPVTGRSAGWAHLILHHWPVSAVIAESGGLFLSRSGTTVRWTFHDDRARVAADRARLLQAAARVQARFPPLRLADDNAFRLVDVAIDHSERVAPPAAPESVAGAIAMIRAEGFQARSSSVHINAWRGSFDKAPMALRYLSEIEGIDPATARTDWGFIGDAPNDESMFAAFPRSVGVANLASVAGHLTHRPTWLTTAPAGAGFVEFAEHWLASRGPAGPGEGGPRPDR